MRQVFDSKLGERVRIESGDYYNQKVGRVVRKHLLGTDTFYIVEFDAPVEAGGIPITSSAFAPSELQIIL
jgi:hypothetical protein